MRTRPDVDTLSIDDFKSSTNKVKSGHTGAYSTYTPSTSSNNIPEREVPTGFADEVIYSLFVKQSKDLDLLHVDLEQIDDLDIEEMDINWEKHTVEEEETNHALMAISSNNEANELYEKDEKLKKYRRIGMKAVKEKEQKTVDSWKDSSKNLWKLVNSGMSSNSKVGLGYGIKSNNEVLSYEEEMNRTVFNCTEEDFVEKPLYNRFSKTDNLKGVPHPLTGDYTPKPQQEIDESLYVYGKKGPQKHKTSVSDDKFNKYSNCQSNDSVVVSEPKPKEVKPSCVTHVKTPRQPMKNQETPKVNGKNWNEMMERELGEENDREAELEKEQGYNTGKWGGKTQYETMQTRPNVNSVRFNVNTVRPKQPVPTSNSTVISPERPQ
ncbi:hypothetical protein Tco_0196278 [Tanacetum coccineum]